VLNTFKLGVHPSSHYLGLFDERAIKLKNTGYGEHSFPFTHAVATIGSEGDDLRFDIIFVVQDGAVLPHQSPLRERCCRKSSRWTMLRDHSIPTLKTACRWITTSPSPAW
jgi:hypothetical protein